MGHDTFVLLCNKHHRRLQYRHELSRQNIQGGGGSSTEKAPNFNKNYVGENSVFPIKNGAPRILEQFRDTLELLDQYTTGNKPKRLPTVGATYYQGKPATRKVLEHFVRTTPVVEKCDDPRCFSRLDSTKARSRNA
jgi:hypothetical protein